MNKRVKNLLIALPILFASVASVFFMAPQPVYASGSGTSLGICTFIGPICQAISGSSTSLDPGKATTFIKDRLNIILAVVFIAIILISVFIILRAGIKYIQSQGDPGKIAEAQKAITSVFVGIAILFVGIIGLVLVLAFFNLTGLTSSNCTLDAQGKVTCTDSSGNSSTTK